MSTDDYRFIEFSTVEPLLPPPPLGLDTDTQELVINFRKKIFQLRLSKVNRNYELLSEVWPQGRPLDYFIGLELCQDDICALVEKLKCPQFTQKVISESAQRGFPLRSSVPARAYSQPIPSFGFDEQSSDEEIVSRRRKGRKKKRFTVRWEQDEINEFIYEYNYNFRNQNWQTFCDKFYGKKEEDCMRLLKRLQREGKVFAWNASMADASDSEQKKSVLTAINFIKGDKKIRVGPISLEAEEKIAMNPIPGYIDMITQKPMEIPALSPDGYALDYSTWLKLLNENKVNPFTQNHMTSKRQLTILTIDNFNYYKDKIINLEQCRPLLSK